MSNLVVFYDHTRPIRRSRVLSIVWLMVALECLAFILLALFRPDILVAGL